MEGALAGKMGIALSFPFFNGWENWTQEDIDSAIQVRTPIVLCISPLVICLKRLEECAGGMPFFLVISPAAMQCMQINASLCFHV